MNSASIKKMIELKANATAAITALPVGKLDGRKSGAIHKTLQNGLMSIGFARNTAISISDAHIRDVWLKVR